MKETTSVCDGCGRREDQTGYQTEQQIVSVNVNRGGSSPVFFSLDVCPDCTLNLPAMMAAKTKEQIELYAKRSRELALREAGPQGASKE